MELPLPEHCSWQVHLIRFGGRTERCAVLWRVSHTVADGVVLSQIMSNVLCEPLSIDEDPPTMAGPPQPLLEARRPRRASWLERIWRMACGTLFVLALIFWPSDVPTCLQLGPYRWRDRLLRRKTAEAEGEPAAEGRDTTPSGGSTAAGNERPSSSGAVEQSAGLPCHGGATRMAVGDPVDVSSLKAAAAAAGVTINDLLMTAVAGGIREYLRKRAATLPAVGESPAATERVSTVGAASSSAASSAARVPAPAAPADDLQLTAVAVINPRTTMPQDLNSSALLDDYAAMVGPGCDITLALLPLPCGAMEPMARLRTLAAETRALKLSPASLLLRFGANLIGRWLGVGSLIAVYTHVLAKFTTYVSNVVAPPVTGALCGVPIRTIWFGTTPLDFGVSFSFLSYAGTNRLTCVADHDCVPDPEAMVAAVREKLLELVPAALALNEGGETAATLHAAAAGGEARMPKVASHDTVIYSLAGDDDCASEGPVQRKPPRLAAGMGCME